MSLTGNQRRHLGSLAHHLNPIVQIGHHGVSEAVVRQLDGALEDHELVKVKLGQSVEDRDGAVEALAAGTGSEAVQLLGRTAVFFRQRTKKPEIVLPKPVGPPAPPLRRRPTRAVPVDAEDAEGEASFEVDESDEESTDEEST
jgi:RNA-binding protein